MNGEFPCFDDPGAIFENDFCLNSASKDLKGHLERTAAERRKCSEPKCITLRTLHHLRVKITSHPPCDSPLGTKLDGELEIERLATAFEDSGEGRGIHAGDFRWSSSAGVITGRISGVTNVGTHRKPVFDPACQECHAPFLEGRLCGHVVDPAAREFRECDILGTYRIIYDSSSDGGEGAIRGTFEGSLICPCRVP